MELSKVEQSALNSYQEMFNAIGNKIGNEIENSFERSEALINLRQSFMWFEQAFHVSCQQARFKAEQTEEPQETEAEEAADA